MNSSNGERRPRRSRTAARRIARRSPHVAGQFFGYSLQATRAVVRLLQAATGSSVSVEVFDDVGVEGPGGGKIAEQTKSATQQNPIADRSVELWKTFANWVDAVEREEITLADTSFELYVSTKRSGPVAESFSAASSAGAAKAALGAAKEKLWGPSPAHTRRRSVAPTLAPHLERVLGADEAIVLGIIERFCLVFGQGASVAEIEALLAAKLISDEMRPAVATQMLGWTKREIDRRLERGAPAVIAVDAFTQELRSFVEKYDRNKILYSFAPEPPQDEVEAELPTRTYIRQLEIIDADYETKLRAANDFLRAGLNRSIWGVKGMVHSSSFDDFEDELLRTWSAKKMAVSVQAKGRPHPEVGQLLYAECVQIRQALEGRPVPPHFTPGCLHSLADAQRLGWHPSYESELAPQPAAAEAPAAT